MCHFRVFCLTFCLTFLLKCPDTCLTFFEELFYFRNLVPLRTLTPDPGKFSRLCWRVSPSARPKTGDNFHQNPPSRLLQLGSALNASKENAIVTTSFYCRRNFRIKCDMRTNALTIKYETQFLGSAVSYISSKSRAQCLSAQATRLRATKQHSGCRRGDARESRHCEKCNVKFGKFCWNRLKISHDLTNFLLN